MKGVFVLLCLWFCVVFSDPQASSWKEVIPIERISATGVCSCCVGGSFPNLGGYLGYTGLSTGVLQFWNTTDQSWHPIADPKNNLPPPRNWGQTATVWGNYLFLFGGQNDQDVLGDLWSFGPVFDQESLLSAQWTLLYDSALSSLGPRERWAANIQSIAGSIDGTAGPSLMLFGGNIGQGANLRNNDVWRWDLSGSFWVNITFDPSFPFPVQQGASATSNYGTKIFYWISDTPYFYRFSLARFSVGVWERYNLIPEPRRYLQAAYVDNIAIFGFGGTNQDRFPTETDYNALWFLDMSAQTPTFLQLTNETNAHLTENYPLGRKMPYLYLDQTGLGGSGQFSVYVMGGYLGSVYNLPDAWRVDLTGLF